MRSIHRIVTFFVVIVTLYLGVTGSLIQLTDFHTILTRAPAHDPNTLAMREDINGPADYAVINADDYDASPLPQGADLYGMLTNVAKSARAQLGTAPMTYLEMRVVDGRPLGLVRSANQLLRFDTANGKYAGTSAFVATSGEPPVSLRNFFKHIHRMTSFGDWALWINVIVSLGLATLIVTGLVMYLRLLRGRAELNRKGLFWIAGGWWKTLHRAVALTASLFLVVVTLSGAWLAVESLIFGFYLSGQIAAIASGHRPPPRPDPTPVRDAALPAMIQTTLNAYAATVPGTPPRVVRLRIYGDMPQGVVVSGEAEANQYVFDANSGKQVSETKPGYPKVGFPFGWQAHQTAKRIHRGDFFGFTGRVMDLLAGFAMIYLSISGIVMYYELWSKRRRQGRKAWIWK